MSSSDVLNSAKAFNVSTDYIIIFMDFPIVPSLDVKKG